MQDVRIRHARSEDLDAILDIQRRAFLQIGSKTYGLALMREALAEVTLFSPDLIEDGHYFLAVAPCGTVLATGGWSQRVPAYGKAVSGAAGTSGRTAITRSVYVCPDHARRGLGRRIMAHLEADAIRHGIETMTMTATLPGLPLYRRLGYRETTPQPAVLPSGAVVDLVGMEKALVQTAQAKAGSGSPSGRDAIETMPL